MPSQPRPRTTSVSLLSTSLTPHLGFADSLADDALRPNSVLQLLKKFGKASSASSSTGQAQSGPAVAAAAGTRASASSSSNGATTTTQAAGAGAQGGASQGTPAPAAAAAPSHSLDGRLQDGSDPLRVLDPSLHSLAYLYILYVLCVLLNCGPVILVKRKPGFAKRRDNPTYRNARLGGTRPDWTELGPLVQAWCETCDVEVARSVPDQGERASPESPQIWIYRNGSFGERR